MSALISARYSQGHTYASQIVGLAYPRRSASGSNSFVAGLAVMTSWGCYGDNGAEIQAKSGRRKTTLPHKGWIKVEFAGVVVAGAARFGVVRVSHESLRARFNNRHARVRMGSEAHPTIRSGEGGWGPPSPARYMCNDAGCFAWRERPALASHGRLGRDIGYKGRMPSPRPILVVLGFELGVDHVVAAFAFDLAFLGRGLGL